MTTDPIIFIFFNFVVRDAFDFAANKTTLKPKLLTNAVKKGKFVSVLEVFVST